MDAYRPPDQSLTEFVGQRIATGGGGPLYLELAEALAEAVNRDLLRRGSALPGERGLSRALGLSRVTVRRAIEELVGRGLLVRRQGARTTVGPRVEKQLATLAGFSEEIRSRGMEPGVRWLSRVVVRPSPAEVMALALAPGDPVVRLERLRLADGSPIAIERATLPQAILPAAEFAGDSLYTALDRLEARPRHGTQRIRAGVMSEREARLLEAAPGTALLIVERRCFLSDGRTVEFTETRYNGDVYDFVTELSA